MPHALASNKREDSWGELGPAVRALQNDRQRAFLQFYLWETFNNKRPKNYGAIAAAARKAGYGNPNTTAKNMGNIGWKLMRDPRMVAAVAEESRKYLRAGAPEAVAAVRALVRNPDHPGHVRGIQMTLDRADPVESRSFVEVTHISVNPDTEALEELRALRALGTSREKLIELFGENGLARIERLERLDTLRRSNEAKVINNAAPVPEDDF
jgi:hypothetical protein